MANHLLKSDRGSLTFSAVGIGRILGQLLCNSLNGTEAGNKLRTGHRLFGNNRDRRGLQKDSSREEE